jgi:hypothetical protein
MQRRTAGVLGSLKQVGYLVLHDLAKQGVELSGEQQTKTALTYFSRGLNVKATADA